MAITSGRPRMGSRVLQCRKQLVRIIRADFAQKGAVLPSQEVLRERLQMSNDTLTTAMKHLVAEGVITRKPGAGSVVADLRKLPSIPWSIGFATFNAPSLGPNAFHAYLLHCLQARLSEYGCRCLTYMRRRQLEPYHLASDFVGLCEDLDEGSLDGIVFLTNSNLKECRSIEKSGVLVGHAGVWGGAPCGTVIDLPTFRSAAVAELKKRGCRRICTVGHLEVTVVGDRAREAFVAGHDEVRHVDTPYTPDKTEAFVRGWVAASRAELPDGLVVLDDYAAAAMCDELARTVRHPPLVAVATNRQLPLNYACPVIRFELDIEELAVRAAEILYARLSGIPVADLVTPVRLHLTPDSVFGDGELEGAAAHTTRVRAVV